MGLLLIPIWFSTTVWVGYDAAQRDWRGIEAQGIWSARSTFWWVIGMVALWIIIFPLYLYARRRVPRRMEISYMIHPQAQQTLTPEQMPPPVAPLTAPPPQAPPPPPADRT